MSVALGHRSACLEPAVLDNGYDNMQSGSHGGWDVAEYHRLRKLDGLIHPLSAAGILLAVLEGRKGGWGRPSQAAGPPQ
jgi:hypothetical protein